MSRNLPGLSDKSISLFKITKEVLEAPMLPAFLVFGFAFWRLILGVYLDDQGKSIKPLQQTPIATLQKMPNNYSAPGLILATVQKSNAIFDPMAT